MKRFFRPYPDSYRNETQNDIRIFFKRYKHLKTSHVYYFWHLNGYAERIVKGVFQTILSLSLIVVFNIEIPKRAFRFYEKGEIDKTVDALEKSLSKSEVNPAAKYLYSLMYVDTAFWGYNVDTAYFYINAAIEDFGTVVEPKDFENLMDVGVDSVSLQVHKDVIDSLSFQLILAKHTIADYNWFMQTHNDAAQIPEAIRLRNHIAFEGAEKINTYESYLGFMQAYPDSEDFSEAQTRYKKLLFEVRTADGKYRSYVDFLEEYPGTPYRDICEEKIFEFSTAINSIPAYTEFLRKYPNSKLKRKIIPRLYHIVKEKYGSDKFLETFEFITNTDSIQQVSALEEGVWMPKLDNDKFIFMNLKGENQLSTNFGFIPSSYRCEPISTDFLIGGANQEEVIIGRNGNVIYDQPFLSAEDIGYGYIKVQQQGGYILVHKSGEIIIDEPVQDIATFDEHFIKVQQNDLWGLTTINKRQILNYEYSMIDTLDSFLILEKDSRIALTQSEALFPAAIEEPISLEFKYDEIEPLDNGYYLVFDGDNESVIDKDQNEILPASTSTIYDREYGWLLKGDSTIQLLHEDYISLQDSVYDNIVENDNWIALQKDEKWTLLDQHGRLFPSYDYDSLQFWGENMVMLQKSDSVYARFKNGHEMLLEDGWTPKLLVPQIYVKTGEKAKNDFFMLTNEKKFRKVYNSWGREILAATYNEVAALGPDLIKLQKKNAALVDSTGAFVLNFIYDGIGSYDDGYVSVLKGDKVGVINIEKIVNIPPTYSTRIQAYNDTVLVATVDGLKGFINRQNEELSGFDYDEIRFWTDTVALARIEDEWLLHRIKDESYVFEGIQEFEFLKDNENERVILVTTSSGKGIISNTRGQIIEPTYNDIIQLGTEQEPIYFAQKFIKEANLYVVIHIDQNGKKLFTQTFEEDQYLKIACSR